MTSKHGISVKLPLTYNSVDGPYSLNKTTKEAVRQNFKNLVLTAPGERVMDTFFGVGLREMLFELNNNPSREEIAERIIEQVDFYLPHIEIVDILFNDPNLGSTLGPNSLSLRLEYRIIPLNDSDLLDITVK